MQGGHTPSPRETYTFSLLNKFFYNKGTTLANYADLIVYIINLKEQTKKIQFFTKSNKKVDYVSTPI